MNNQQVKVFLDKVQTNDRKLNHFLKKRLDKATSFQQLDHLALNIYFYLKNNRLKADKVWFTVRVVFSDDYLPVMSLKLPGYTSTQQQRLSVTCFKEVEIKLLKNYEAKTEHEKKVVHQDIKTAFKAFIQSGFLRAIGDEWYQIAIVAEHRKKFIQSLSQPLTKKERQTLNFFQGLSQREEVLNNVG